MCRLLCGSVAGSPGHRRCGRDHRDIRLRGTALALVVGLATLVLALTRRRARRLAACLPQAGPVDVLLGAPPVDEARR